MATSATRFSTGNHEKIETCIDLIFSSEEYSISLGWTDHNIVTITKNTRSPRKPLRIVVKRSFKSLNQYEFQNDLAVVPGALVYLEDNLDHATECFTQLLIEVMEHHAPVRKMTDSNSINFSV